MTINSRDKRLTVGLLINNAAGYYQSALTKGMIKSAEYFHVNLLVFNGGYLNFEHDKDFNQIYHLVSQNRLDGLIVSSTLGDFSKNQDFQDILQLMKEIPAVTIGYRFQSIPAVLADNYGSMKFIVKHMIEDHKFKRIAFVSGPLVNNDALERFNAYKDALQESQIEFDPEIVYYSNFTFEDGIEIGNKIAAFKKIPFESIVFANDEMALAAAKVLKAKNINIPVDLAITGFDDIPEADFSNQKLTTVRKSPNDEAAAAMKAILDLIQGVQVPQTKVVSSQPVIRESCGCKPLRKIEMIHSRNEKAEKYEVLDKNNHINIEKQLLLNKDKIINMIISSLAVDDLIRNELKHGVSVLFDMLLFDLKSLRSQPMVLMILDEWFELTQEWNNFNEIWQNIITQIQDKFAAMINDPDQHQYLDKLVYKMLNNLTKWINYHENRTFFKLHEFLKDNPTNLGMINSELNKDEILKILKTELRKTDLIQMFIVLFQKNTDASNKNKKAELVLAVDNNKEFSGSEEFPLAGILPDRIFEDEMRYPILFMGLFCRGEHFGYIGLGLNGFPSITHYIVREQISNALYTSELFNRYKEEGGKSKAFIDELKQKELENSELVQNLPFAVLETDRDCNISFINRAGMDAFGLDPQGLLNNNSILRFLSQKDQELLQKAVQGKNKSEGNGAAAGLNQIHLDTPHPLIIYKIELIKGADDQVKKVRWSLINPEPLMVSSIVTGENLVQKYHITKREKEVMDLLIQGYRKKDIALKLFITENTVKGHITELYDKLGVNSHTDMITLVNQFYSRMLGWDAYAFNLLFKLIKPNE